MNERLRSVGWTVLRFWSHESPTEAARAVARVIATVDAQRRISSSCVNAKN